MSIEFLISWRYLVTKRKQRFISLISIISILGIAIGVMALIIVLAVMSGFDKDLKEKIVGNYSDITVYKDLGMDNYGVVGQGIQGLAHVRAVSPNVQGQVLVSSAGRIFAVALRGIVPETEVGVTRVKEYIVRGSLDNLNADGVIIGKELAGYLGLNVGDNLAVMSAAKKTYNLKVAGVFSSGMYDYDMNLIVTHIKKAQEIFGLGDIATELTVKLDNLAFTDKVKAQMQDMLGYEYIAKTWAEKNVNFFAALQLEKLTMFIILTLIILVASFNIISTLTVLVSEKIHDIGILKAIGMNAASIRRIFTLEGVILGVLGTLLGAFSGVGLCLLLKKYQFIKLPPDIYYLDKLPVSLTLWPDITVIVLASLMITFISTIYPASKAARLNTVEALRYE